jgi:hypothetical protein
MTTRASDLADSFPVGGRQRQVFAARFSPHQSPMGWLYRWLDHICVAISPTRSPSPAGSANARKDPIVSNPRYPILYTIIERKDTSGQLR